MEDYNNIDDSVPESELDKPIQNNSLPPLPLLPEREWLAAVVSDIRLTKVIFGGKVQYFQNKDKEDILDDDGKKIERRQIKITYSLRDYMIGKDTPRQGWLNLGLSWGKNAILPQYLKKVYFKIDEDNLPTPRQIIEYLKGKKVWIQFVNNETEDGETKQKIEKLAVKLDEQPKEETPRIGIRLHKEDQDVTEEDVEAEIFKKEQQGKAWDE